MRLLEQTLSVEEAERELLIVTRGAHRHRDGLAVDANLERLLNRDRVRLSVANDPLDGSGGGLER
jgi:hypothetical protein